MPESTLHPAPHAQNPAYTLEWGIDPPSRRRRFRQQILTWLPLAAYIPVFGYLVFAALGREGEARTVIAPFLSAISATTIYLFRLALMRTPRVLRRDVRIDILMTGISARQLLFGTARPVLHGITIILAVHYLLVFRSLGEFSQLNSSDAVFILFLCSTPIAALLLGASLAPPLWVLTKYNLLRVVYIALMVFGWLVQYWILFGLIFGLTMAQLGFEPLWFMINLFLSMIVPGFLIFRLWTRALRKLGTIE